MCRSTAGEQGVFAALRDCQSIGRLLRVTPELRSLLALKLFPKAFTAMTTESATGLVSRQEFRTFFSLMIDIALLNT